MATTAVDSSNADSFACLETWHQTYNALLCFQQLVDKRIVQL